MELTYAQRTTLTELTRSDSYAHSRSGTNSTLNALERRGLVELNYVPIKRGSKYTKENWQLTDAGREAVS